MPQSSEHKSYRREGGGVRELHGRRGYGAYRAIGIRAIRRPKTFPVTTYTLFRWWQVTQTDVYASIEEETLIAPTSVAHPNISQSSMFFIRTLRGDREACCLHRPAQIDFAVGSAPIFGDPGLVCFESAHRPVEVRDLTMESWIRQRSVSSVVDYFDTDAAPRRDLFFQRPENVRAQGFRILA